MTTKEKAKAYDEAIEKARDLYNQGLINQPLQHIFPELRESEDEKIRKELIEFVKSRGGFKQEYIAWLEKQSEHANFRNKIQIGDKVTRNEDGVLVNLSQLNRVAKKDEKQGEQKPYGQREECSDCQFNYAGECKGYCAMKRGEQKPADKVEQKFHEGEWIIFNGLTLYVKEVVKGYYRTISINGIPNSYDWDIDNVARLWTIQEANDGDVLVDSDGSIFIFKEVVDNSCKHYIALTTDNIFVNVGLKYCWEQTRSGSVKPATKEQRDTLMKAMADAGYTFDFEKKELKKVDNEEVNGEDYGIDSLYHAQRILEKTLGSVNGYQSDDGILEHKCAITAVKKLYKQKPAEWSDEDMKEALRTEYEKGRADAFAQMQKSWSEEDDEIINGITSYLCTHDSCELDGFNKWYDWLKFLKERYTWKPSDEQMKILNEVLNFAANHESSHWNDYIFGTLNNLIRQLKKLREE